MSGEEQKFLETTIKEHRKIARDLLIGSLAGAIGIYLTQPIDTVRIRMQNDIHTYKSIPYSFKVTYANEGIRGFFKGSISNIYVGMGYYSLLFAAKEFSDRFLNPITWLSENQKIFISGSFGGFCCIFMATPLELLKCKAQVNTSQMTSYTQLVGDLIREGGLKALYKGFWGTFWRDVPMYGFFFFVYDFLQRHFIKENDSEYSKHLKLVWISGLAGVLNWVPTYPADLVKTKIQCHEGPETLRIADVIRAGYRDMGMKFFYSGISPTVLMAGPLHILVMLAYENMQNVVPEF